ncbi:MAG: hypothetical protein WBP45_14490 [Daejeonella sp.]
MKKTKNSMYALLAGGLLLTAFTFNGCSKNKTEDPTLPKIGGYNNSNEVAITNLKAHWSFDDTKNEVISNTAPTSYGGVSFVTGQIGKALNLADGALVFPAIANINTANSLSNYTVSMWVNVKNTGTTFTSLFGIIPTDVVEPWGNLGSNVETAWFVPASDTLVLKANYLSSENGVNNGQDNRPDPKGTPPVGVFKSAGKWCHYVVRWDASTHKLQIFGNNVSIGAYDNRGTTGPLVMRVPCKAVVGSLAATDIGFAGAPVRDTWMPKATAVIDDIRVFNKSLSDIEIKALFDLGTAGR